MMGASLGLMLGSARTTAAPLGSMTVTNPAVSAENLTTAGYNDWFVQRAFGNFTWARKTGANLIVAPDSINDPINFLNSVRGNSASFPAAYTWTSGDGFSSDDVDTNNGTTSTGPSPGGSNKIEDSGTGTFPRAQRYLFPSTTTDRAAWVVFGLYTDQADATVLDIFAKFTLADGSAPEQLIRLPHTSFTTVWTAFKVVYRSAGASTLRADLQMGTNGGVGPVGANTILNGAAFYDATP
jgi:hypothetical protein